jgi:hypothetical protein
MMNDVFKDGFTLTELSQAINILPNTYGRVMQLGLFQWRPQSTRTVTIEIYNGVLALVPTVSYGGVATKNKTGKRNIRSFEIPHTPFEDVVLASDVQGIRKFASENNSEVVMDKVNEKLQVMKNKIDQTMEWRMLGALKGVVLDADATVIEDYFAAFGVTKKTVTFALGTAGTNVRAKCMEVKRYIEDNLLGERMTTVRALVSQEFFDALVDHPNVKAVYANYQASQERNGGDMRSGFDFGGIVFEEYRGIVGTQRFIDASKGHAFPVGTAETFSNFGAPADFMETVNTVALPYYARQQMMDFERGIELHTQANFLPMVTRPGVIVELVA